MYVPFTGLGLYKGFRGNAWLRNRIEIFKQFVIPSLTNQTSQNFILWISWRWEERNNPIVTNFISWLEMSFNLFDYEGVPKKKIVHTFSGVCFYDDKYPDDVARVRLIDAIQGAMPTLFDVLGDCEEVLMTIQPSDDLYHKQAVEGIQKMLSKEDCGALGFQKGYICNYYTKEVSEYNPTTNPPFYTVRFKRDDFIDPLRHIQFTSLKQDSGKYKKGTPCPSHEYIGECVKYAIVSDLRGFMVGTHGANISTTFSNPYKGRALPDGERHDVLHAFGIFQTPLLQIKVGLGKKIMLKLPFKVQRKLRYWLNEKFKL